MNRVDEKIAQAEDIVVSCLGERGVWADPTRYRHQCWTRDLVIATAPLLLEDGQWPLVRNHLVNLSGRQRLNGRIPTLFLDRTWPFLAEKASKSLRDGKLSFMLRRYLAGQLWNLTPGTRDSEILYVIGMHEYARASMDVCLYIPYLANIKRAMAYVEENLMRDGLVIGCDWRDTMERELGDLPLLTNNSLLCDAYRLSGEFDKAARLRRRINEVLWDGERYLDYPGSQRFDPLGGAFAVLRGVAPRERYASLKESFLSVDTPCGITIKCRHNPTTPEEREVIERTDGVVVWPFVVGFTALALLRIGARDLAMEQFEKLTALDGFREWYDPATGKGYGAGEQLWSAALFLRAARAMAKPLPQPDLDLTALHGAGTP